MAAKSIDTLEGGVLGLAWPGTQLNSTDSIFDYAASNKATLTLGPL